MNADRIEEITEELIPLRNRLNFLEDDSESRDNEYMAWLDEVYPEDVQVGWQTFKVSRILKNCSSETDWRIGRNECFQEETETLWDQINDLTTELETFNGEVAGQVVEVIPFSYYYAMTSDTSKGYRIDFGSRTGLGDEVDKTFCPIYLKVSGCYYVKTIVRKDITQEGIKELAKLIYETL